MITSYLGVNNCHIMRRDKKPVGTHELFSIGRLAWSLLDGSAPFVEDAEVQLWEFKLASWKKFFDPTAKTLACFFQHLSFYFAFHLISVTLLAWIGLHLVRNVSRNFINSSWNLSRRLSTEIFMKESWTNLELAQSVQEGHFVEERMSEKNRFSSISEIKD